MDCILYFHICFQVYYVNKIYIISFQLKNLLSNECDLLYECKVCRNIFRSLANFISHKRVYCKEKFKTSIHGNFFKETSTVSYFAHDLYFLCENVC